MVVGADGKILVRNSKQASQGQMTTGKAMIRTGKAAPKAVILSGKQRFMTATEIADRRIKPSLPPQATEISLLSERGGHFAKYKVAEAELMRFLDGLWDTGKESSADESQQMSGEGERASREQMIRHFKINGWEPLDMRRSITALPNRVAP